LAYLSAIEFVEADCLRARQLRDLIGLIPIGSGYSTVELKVARTIICSLTDLSAEIDRLRETVASAIPAAVEAEVNRLGSVSASTPLQSEAADAVEKRLLETGAQMERQLSDSAAVTAAKAEAALSAVAEKETEIALLREEIRQLKALVAATVPAGAICPVEAMPDCQQNCDNILTFCEGHWSVKSSPAFQEERLKSVIGSRSAVHSGWFSDPQFRSFPSITIRFDSGISAVIDRYSLGSGLC
jgi:hypothetical protein